MQVAGIACPAPGETFPMPGVGVGDLHEPAGWCVIQTPSFWLLNILNAITPVHPAMLMKTQGRENMWKQIQAAASHPGKANRLGRLKGDQGRR